MMDADGKNEKRVSDIDAFPFPGRASWQPVFKGGPGGAGRRPAKELDPAPMAEQSGRELHKGDIEALYREAIAVPAARQAGVRTPALVVFDDTRDLVSVPYVIYERVHGETLAELDLEPLPAADV